MTIIDFHAHAFPDELALKTIPVLAKKAGITAVLDGTMASLLRSMDKTGIDQSVIGCIATRPEQFESILAWSNKIRSERIIPFPSFHPDDPDMINQIRRIKDEGFKGIKLHPYYQEFSIDEERLLPAYEAISDLGLILLIHAGFDIGFLHIDIANPERTVRVIEQFPDLKLIAAHLGGWKNWDKVQKYLIGRHVYIDLAYSLEFMEAATAREMLLNHPEDKILFGSDSPWADQQKEINRLKDLNLGSRLEAKILGQNGAKLLRTNPPPLLQEDEQGSWSPRPGH